MAKRLFKKVIKLAKTPNNGAIGIDLSVKTKNDKQFLNLQDRWPPLVKRNRRKRVVSKNRLKQLNNII